MRDEDEEMSARMRASENIAWGFLGKPAQQVFAAHAHVDVSDDLPKNADELEKAAALYAAMIGAGDDAAASFDRPILDVTPSRVLPAPDDHDDMEAGPARLRKLTAEEAVEEVAEQRQRVRRPQTRERVRRSR
jgi:hypothetical protein